LLAAGERWEPVQDLPPR